MEIKKILKVKNKLLKIKKLKIKYYIKILKLKNVEEFQILLLVRIIKEKELAKSY